MTATRTSRRTARRTTRRSTRRTMRARKSAPRRAAKPAVKATAKPVAKPTAKIVSKRGPPAQILYRICRSGWAVMVETAPNAQGTRFVCPFCTVSHRVSGPVRGFRKLRRAQWVKLRRVEG